MPDVHDENKLFVCGTGGYAPRKYSLNVSIMKKKTFCFFVDLQNLKHIYLRLVMRKPVFGVCDQFILKPACSAADASYSLEI